MRIHGNRDCHSQSDFTLLFYPDGDAFPTGPSAGQAGADLDHYGIFRRYRHNPAVSKPFVILDRSDGADRLAGGPLQPDAQRFQYQGIVLLGNLYTWDRITQADVTEAEETREIKVEFTVKKVSRFVYFSTAQRDAVEAMLTRYEQEQAELNLKAKAKN